MTGHEFNFWRCIPLELMSRKQWESLCDRCGKCCLHKIEDEDTQEVFFSNVVCRHFNLETGLCNCYDQRSALRTDCVTLTREVLAAEPHWLPATCAYRRLAEGGDLPPWHPLVTGDPSSVMRSGNSVLGRVVAETAAGSWEYNLIDWVT